MERSQVIPNMHYTSILCATSVRLRPLILRTTALSACSTVQLPPFPGFAVTTATLISRRLQASRVLLRLELFLLFLTTTEPMRVRLA
eukprot:6202811-Pleurochrysis_carterae.AAC.5